LQKKYQETEGTGAMIGETTGEMTGETLGGIPKIPENVIGRAAAAEVYHG